MLKTHILRTWPKHLEAVIRGDKTFEVRQNDRDFAVGDILDLREWDPETQEYGPRSILHHVTYILEGGQFGIEEGYVVMGLDVRQYGAIIENKKEN